MDEVNEGQENFEEAAGSGPPDSAEGSEGESEGGEMETRLAALTGELESLREESGRELESLRVESGRQLESLQTENAAQLAAFCELARSLPGVVPELVGGENLAAVRASVVAAREAYGRIAADLNSSQVGAQPGEPGPGQLPGAGGGVRSSSPADEDQPSRPASGRGVNLIYQALVGGKSGNLAR